MISTRIAEAPIAWNHLNGIINAFKPAEVSVRKLRSALLGNICKGKFAQGRRGHFKI